MILSTVGLTTPCFPSLQCLHRLAEFRQFLSKSFRDAMIMRGLLSRSIFLPRLLSPVFLRIGHLARWSGFGSSVSTPSDPPHPSFSITVAAALLLLLVTSFALRKLRLMRAIGLNESIDSICTRKERTRRYGRLVCRIERMFV